MRSRITRQIVAGLPLIGSWAIFSILLKDDWFGSYNGLTMGLWVPMVWSGSIIATIAAWQEADRIAHHQEPIWLSAPRSWLAVQIREILVGYSLSALLPTLFMQGILLAIGASLSLPGYFDPSYGFYALAFSFIAYLLGVLIAHAHLGPLRSAIISLFLGLYAGMYVLVTGSEVDTWEIFPNEAWAVICACLLVLSIAIVLVSFYRIVNPVLSRTTTIVGAALTVALIFGIGGVQVGNSVRSDYENTTCEKIGEDSLCVWSEDSFKMDDLRGFLERTRALRSRTGVEELPIAAVEPHVPVDVALASMQIESDEYVTMNFVPMGGQTPSWPAAQGFAASLPWNYECFDTKYEDYSTLFDIVTNFIYGDVAYAGFQTADTVRDGVRVNYAQALAKLSTEEQLARLGAALSGDHTTCPFTLEDLLTHD